ncbi:MAG: hypothetical protein IJM90_04900 [Firmicutes bacterium]|nr:hypothetical protein [Bacillota bacterium]
MRSDVIIINTRGNGVEDALNQANAVALYKGLNNKQGLHLRLLIEEMMGLVRAVTGEHDYKFWIEDKDNVYGLHLTTETIMNAEKREQLLAATTTGHNDAAVGIIGKIRDAFEKALEARDEFPYDDGFFLYDEPDASTEMMSMRATMMEWSLNRYRETANEQKEKWDELEKSIIAKVADEVRIYIKGNQVELVVYKKF